MASTFQGARERQIDRHKLQSYQLMASFKREHLNNFKPLTYIPPPPTKGLATPKGTGKIVEASFTISTVSATVKYSGFQKVSTPIPSAIGNTDDVGHVLPNIALFRSRIWAF
jgi:hypothetical protein